MINEMQNYIGGNNVSTESKFSVKSPFYNDYSIVLPNSTPREIEMCLGYGRSYRKRRINPVDVLEILKYASELFDIRDEEISYVVKFTGLPAKVVKTNLVAIKDYMKNFGDIITRRGYRVDENGIYRSLGNKSLEFRKPIEDSIVGYLPYGDLFPIIFIMSHSIISGRDILIRPSSNLAYIPVKLAQTITEAASRKGLDILGAINILTWDSKDPSRHVNIQLINQRTSSESRIGFGDSETLKLLGVGISYDRGSCKAIVDETADIKLAASSIAAGSLENPLSCDATRMVWVHEEVADEFENALKEEFSRRKVGDPLNSNTDIGFVDFNDLTRVLNLIDHNTRWGSEELLYPEIEAHQIRKNNYQADPIILRTYNLESPLMRGDYNVYMLIIRHFSDFNEAIKEINSPWVPLPLTISYYGEDRKYTELAKRSSASHINLNRNTRDHNLVLPHQGKYPFEIWTEVISVND